MNNLKKLALLSAGLFLLGCSNTETEEPMSSTTEEAAMTEAEETDVASESTEASEGSNDEGESGDTPVSNEADSAGSTETSDTEAEGSSEGDGQTGNSSPSYEGEGSASGTTEEKDAQAIQTSEAQVESELSDEEIQAIEDIVAADSDLSNDYENYFFLINEEGNEYKVEIRENTEGQTAPMVGIYYYNRDTGQVDRLGVTGEREKL